MSIISSSSDEFTRELFEGFAAIEQGGIAWTAEAPLPSSWFTGDASHDLDRALDLLCEADTELIDLGMHGQSGTAEYDQKRTRAARLSDLVDFLGAVVETIETGTVQA